MYAQLMFTQEMNYFASEKLSLLYSVTFQPYQHQIGMLLETLLQQCFFKALQSALVIVKYLGIF